MIRPSSLDAFIADAASWIPAKRLQRIDRYTRRLFADAIVMNPDGTTFVLTGDIPAMWIRDSTWQVLPLLRMQPGQDALEILAGVSRMQCQLLAIDPYANAFNNGPTGACWHRDFADQSPWVFERKFEIDSISACFELALSLHERAGIESHLDAQFWSTAALLVEVLEREQHHDSERYRFERINAPAADYLSHGGRGAPFRPNGLVWSGFRPSDDRCELPFLVPANAHIAAVLRRFSVLAASHGHVRLGDRAHSLHTSISSALIELAEEHERWPYEVDGAGGVLFGDDPNYPSLLSLPFLGWCANTDATYLATRSFLLSEEHAQWRQSAIAEGLASDHTPNQHIWPLAIAMRGITASSRTERLECLNMLEATDAGTGNMHESFDVHDPTSFTRGWFSWADMTYSELVMLTHTKDASP